MQGTIKSRFSRDDSRAYGRRRRRTGIRNRHNALLRDYRHDGTTASRTFKRPMVGQANTLIHARAVLHADTQPFARPATAQSGTINLTLLHDLASVERDWRHLEETGDCTPFQTFDWLSAWQRHIGSLTHVAPAIVTGRCGGEILFLLPLAVERGTFVRRLNFLGQELCDYNAPLLARAFSQYVTPDRFGGIWRDVLALIQSCPALRHDMVVLAK